jgi:hypothetical protein
MTRLVSQVRLEADPGVELLVIDNEQPSPVYEPAAYAAVYKRIARSNTQVRFCRHRFILATKDTGGSGARRVRIQVGADWFY